MSSILQPRFHFKTSEGFEYPKYYEYWYKALTSVWNHMEVSMSEDVINWQQATEEERKILGGILRAFTQTECVIGDYWREISSFFPKPEIKMMCDAFSFFEGIHQVAYNHLSATLGIDEYKEYIGNPIAQKKVEYLLTKIKSPKVRLAIFSGAAEGVALFSAFSILLSFCKESKFKGLSQIISWSIADEGKGHSDAGCDLFKDLIKEEGITQDEIDLIIGGFNNVLQNEYAFLNNVFGSLTHINNLPKEAFMEFLKYRYNNRLENLGISPKYYLDYNKDLSFQISSWFDPMTSGNISQDFFAYNKDGSQYASKPTFDISNINWNNLVLT